MVLKQQSTQPMGAAQWQFAALVEHSADLVAITSLQGQIQFLNAAGLRLLGFDSVAAALNTNSAVYLEPQAETALRQRILPTVQHGGAWVGELEVRNIRTGELIPVLANMFLLNEPTNGEPVGYATVMRDLRERQLKRVRYQLLAEAGTELGGTLDRDTMLLNLTRAAVRHFARWCAVVLFDELGNVHELALAHADPSQYDELRGTLLGWPIDQASLWRHDLSEPDTLFLPDLAESAFNSQGWERLRPLGGPSLIATPLQPHDRLLGAVIFASPTGRYYTDEDRQFIDLIGNRTAAALEHARLYQRAQNAVSVRDQFISIASHELRTPLTSVLGNLQLLQRRLERANGLNERDQRTLQTAIDQTLRLNRLIDGLLDISRLQQGHLPLERQLIDVRTFVSAVVEELRPVLDNPVTLDLGDGAVYIQGDRLRLEQVLLNLLHNAAKYSPNSMEISVQVAQSPNQATIAVSDHGIGIPRESLPHLFERFYRAPNAEAQRVSGLGIGLFIVREIVALHGGTINVESASGRGSTFTVSLPLER